MGLQIARFTDQNASLATLTAKIEACNTQLKMEMCIINAKCKEALASHEHLFRTLSFLKSESRVIAASKSGCTDTC